MPKVSFETLKKLQEQLGNYQEEEAHSSKLTEKAGEILFKGCDTYTLDHNDRIKAHNPDDAAYIKNTQTGLYSHYFRREFLAQAILKIEDDTKNFSDDRGKRESRPESATISLSKLFGKEGLELYKKALEEEMHDPKYRDAVFNRSTVHIEGHKFTQRPVAFIAGPSACGKTYVSQAKGGILDQVCSMMPVQKDDKSGNRFVSVDGGIVREMSQIRKLAIYAANLKGYSGITDLHAQSEILEDVKSYVFKAACTDQNFGILIPETFSKMGFPIVESNQRELMKTVHQLDNSQIFFAHVKGSSEEHFKDVVHYMGNRRAWKTSGFDQVTIDLNDSKGMAESKAYGPLGFHFGVKGSKNAESAYKEYQEAEKKPSIIIEVSNDLILLKPKAGQEEAWEKANSNDKGVILVSEQIFQNWQKTENSSSPELEPKDGEGLQAYAKRASKPSIKILADQRGDEFLQKSKSQGITRDFKNQLAELKTNNNEDIEEKPSPVRPM